jgi:hypothetical protein
MMIKLKIFNYMMKLINKNEQINYYCPKFIECQYIFFMF